ncbi:hypothetical protein MA16_Dca008647 [Dendrobium catenatum]|uniref:Uncharacterized protein n=1 Tax=Dendrobium catenatum TaxID=906689 RepID=A0A2I0W4E6_9ASPA|nr:hypothetical protein MA16_Dca008647 [Dendrobium catenatum]
MLLFLDEALPPDPLNSKEVDEIEKAKLCRSNGGKENYSYVIKQNYHSISEDGVVFLEPQHNKSFDEVLMPDPGSSQEACEEMPAAITQLHSVGPPTPASVHITVGVAVKK